jgi:dinuclear metal center YbgI/SA1388 family protein
MMKLLDIYNKLNELSPFEFQEAWDNSGLQIGSMSDEISGVVVSLDLDEELIAKAKEGTLFITHHPLIFGKLTELNFDVYPANIIKMMMDKNLKLIAMHTNFDQTHLNAYVAEKILGLTLDNHEDYIATATVDTTLDAMAERVKKALGLEQAKMVRCEEEIKTVALCTGAGASMIGSFEADLFLTGDIKYHDAMTAKSLNLSLIDIGHFESECFFSEILAAELKDWEISVIISNSKNPFEIA